MAPDISDKKTKVCKKYTHSDHNKYRQWEKERRARFNDKLEDLASCLPNYDKENPWKKVEIVENAIIALKSKLISAKKSSDIDTIRKLSALSRCRRRMTPQSSSWPSRLAGCSPVRTPN